MTTADTHTKLTGIDALRALYSATRAGEPLDVPAYIEALLAAAADGSDVNAVVVAFEAFGYHTRLDIVGACEGAGARVRAARDARGWQGAIRVASLLGLSDVWAAAMTAHYGPTGTCKSRCDANDVPTLETLAEFPRIGERMAAAAERFEGLTGWYDRVNAGRNYPVEQIVRYAPRSVAAA
jgi:hypothetical protein